MNFVEKLKEMGACPPAIKWAKNYGTLDEAWAVCERGDWMMWLIGRTCVKNSPDHISLVKLTCRIARDVLPFVAAGETRPLKAIEAAEKWIDDPSDVNMENAWAAAGDDAGAAGAAGAAAGAAAWAAARAAARAAGAAAWAAGDDAGAAARAAGAAAWAAGDDAGAAAWAAGDDAWAARTAVLKKYAGWTREAFPNPPKIGDE